MPANIDGLIAQEMQENDDILDQIAQTLVLGGQMLLPHIGGGATLDATEGGLSTGELFAVTRETQKIENEDQILPVPRNKQNEIVRGAIEQMKRQ